MSKIRITMLLTVISIAAAMSVMFYLRLTSRELAKEISTANALLDSSLSDVHLIQHESEKLKWVLNSEKVDVLEGEKYVDFKGVDLLIVSNGDEQLRVRGDSGRYIKDSNDFRVWGNVRISSDSDYTFYTEDVHWDIDAQKIKTNGTVRAEGLLGYITGGKMTMDLQDQKIYLTEKVKAQLNR